MRANLTGQRRFSYVTFYCAEQRTTICSLEPVPDITLRKVHLTPMAHFALTCPDAAGHVLPLGAMGCELQRRGHRVTLVARAKAASLAAQLGLPFHELKTEGVPFVSADLLWTVFGVFRSNWVISLRCSAEWDALVMLLTLPATINELRIDGVIADQVFPGAATASERAGVPCVNVCSAPPWNEDPAQPPPFTPWFYKTGLVARLRNRCGYAAWRWYIGPTLRVINRYRREWGLRRFTRMDECYSPLAQISQFFPEFDFPRALRAGVLSLRRCAGRRRAVQRRWLPLGPARRAADHLCLARHGRRSNEPAGLSQDRRRLPGTSGPTRDARGKWDEDELGREATYDLPGDPLVVNYAPQGALLERAALLITHAGLNTTLQSIGRGVPMVALPRSADQPGIAARIAYSGAGLCAPFHHGTPEQLRGVIERVLSDGQFRRRAAELKTAMRRAGGALRAAEIAEEALLERAVRAVPPGFGDRQPVAMVKASSPASRHRLERRNIRCCQGSLSNWPASFRPLAEYSLRICFLLILCSGLIGTFGIFPAELDQGDSSVRLERFADRLQHRLRLGEFVVHVDHQDEVDRVLLQAGIGFRAQMRHDVFQLGRLGASLKHVEHLLLDVNRIDAARLANQRRELERVKSVAAAHVADHLAGLDVQLLQDSIAVLFALPRIPR